MIKLGKKSKLGLGMMIAGGAVMTMGAMVLKQGRKIDKELAALDLVEDCFIDEICVAEEVEDCPIEAIEEEKEKEAVLAMNVQCDEEDDDMEYNPKAEHKAMTQGELEQHSDLGTF